MPRATARTSTTTPSSLTATITGTSGGNFEHLVVGTGTATAHVNDTIDTTTVTLDDAVAGSTQGTSTITAHVDHAVTGSDLLVNLSNGETITIAVGASSGTSSAFASPTDTTVSIVSTSGGNFEALNTADTSFVKDTQPPAAPTGLDLAAADDTGALSTDNITKNTSALTISGSGENGATVTLFDDANNNGMVDAGESLGTTTVAGGTFSLDVSLAAGTHNVRAIQTDVAGNVSAASTTHALDITVDTTATAPTGLDLAAADDTGATTAPTTSPRTPSALTISGSGETGATVTLFDDANNNGVVDAGESLGTTTVAGGTFSLDVSLAAGTHNVRAIQTDVAGNVSAASTTHALDITVDTTAPSAPTGS